MAIKLKKTLYVGVGGTGVATLLKVKKCFIDSYGEVPPMIGFLAIDTDKAISNKSVTSNNGEEIKLAPSELLVCSVRGALLVYRANQREYDWVPSQNVNSLSGIQGGGAGQVRSNGRFIAYYNKNAIDTRVSDAINNINQLIPQGSKYEVDVNVNDIEYPININVVGSIAGGTGSGMMIDILCIIQETLRNTTTFKLYPWIVLPEVFRAMASGPSMANVLYNTYGAMRELDYMMHYDPTTPAINFGYARIDEQLFDYAYVINNTNSAGVSFNNLDDITDVIAKSMFLPANKMGDAISSPFDNIRLQKDAGTYDILNKKSWAASTSSAELVYDSQAVGRVYAYRTIHQLCTSMLQSPTDGSEDANRFVDDPDVLIRENEGQDNVIDALLSPGPDYLLEIDENTTQNNIDSYIAHCCDESQLKTGLNDNLNSKFNTASIAFDKYIADIMCRQQGKVDAAIKFIEALKEIFAICKGEMQNEGREFHDINDTPEQWDYYINAVSNSGIVGIFRRRNEEAIEVLQNKLTEVVTNRREELRRKWALAFYNKFETEVLNPKLQGLQGLKTTIETIAENCKRILVSEKQKAQSTSNFQIFLHKQDVDTASAYSIDDNVKAAFVTFLENGMSSWIGQSQDYIEKKLWSFAEETTKVREAINTDIDSVLHGMSETEVKAHLERLKILASPLWTYNTHGFANTAKVLDKFVVVGVGNRDTSILKTDDKYNTFFDVAGNSASFASTNQHDRVYVLVVEDLLPIYAVNNFKTYELDHQLRVGRSSGMVNYLDEKLNNRMNSENFDLMPAVEADNILDLWVMGFVFGLIHYDKEGETYWIRSKKRGDALRQFRFDLNKSRDVAYDIFKSEQLYKEVEDSLNAMIARTGRDPIDEKINEIKENGNYLEEVSQLSPLERDNVYNPKFRSVKELIEKEVKLMSN